MTQEAVKKVSPRNRIIVLFVFCLVLVGYGYYELVLKQEIYGSMLIDNPTEVAINVSIDGKPYQVPPKAYVKIKMEEGNHTIDCKEYNLNGKEFRTESPFGVINPTGSKYVTYNIIYTQKDLSDQFQAYNIEGKEIYSLLGEPELSDGLFIEDRTKGKGNLDSDFSSSKIYSRTSDYTFVPRIFRLEDFFKWYDEQNK